jgi:2-phosphosulfolactate phosphatase
VVDTLSFSSAVVTAVQHGAEVYPCRERENEVELARRLGAEAALGRSDAPARSRFSLSPLTYLGIEPGARVVLRSPNGATCCRAGRGPVLVGCLLNATAAAGDAAGAAGGRCVTVVACGERWVKRGEDGPLRVAIEDLLGAGAIISALPGSRSPEARVAEAAFLSLRGEIADLIADSGSGRELAAYGYAADVVHASRLDRYAAVPRLHADGWLRG